MYYMENHGMKITHKNEIITRNSAFSYAATLCNEGCIKTSYTKRKQNEYLIIHIMTSAGIGLLTNAHYES